MSAARTRIDPKAFYTEALTEAERERLKAARKVDGLEEEVAMLRVRLLTALKERPEDDELCWQALVCWCAPSPRNTVCPRRRAKTWPTG